LNQKYIIQDGDFLFSRANTLELVGACVIANRTNKTLMLSDKILRFTFSKEVSKKFALYFLRSRIGRKQIEMLSTGNQDSMRNIGQEKISPGYSRKPGSRVRKFSGHYCFISQKVDLVIGRHREQSINFVNALSLLVIS
jgi:hypothetical protein